MRNSPLALAVDDDARMQRLIKLELTNQGFRVETADGGDSALQLMESKRPDVVILDVLMPDKDGYEVLKELRSRSKIPVLMLTAKDADQDKIRGLEMGADDYLPKPFNPAELTARVRAILRREQALSGTEPIVRVDDLEIHLDERTVTKGGEPLDLTRTEWLMLYQLASNQGKVLLHAELLSEIWGPEYVDDVQYLRVWISRLRSKLGDSRDGPGLIKTLMGIGYVFDPENQFAFDGTEGEATPAGSAPV